MHPHSDLESNPSRESDFSVSDSAGSHRSYHSYDTASTDYSSSPRPPFVHHETCDGRLEAIDHHTRYEPQYYVFDDPRSSIETYASTVDFEDDSVEDEPHHQVPLARPPQIYPSDALPATPADFGELFPSRRLLYIKHDDSTDDGNMNLRLDTPVHIPGGKSRDITLFHLRMHDLKKRDFSLRRYCRDSGREVCHAVRKDQQTSADSRPGLGRSLTHALAAMLSISDSKSATSSKLKRSDSGYGSIKSRASVDVEQESMATSSPSSKRHSPIPTNTTKLEFSNYSQVEVKRRGTKNSKRYEFEYWGTSYTWKRVIEKETSSMRVLYHLYRANDPRVLARIEPSFLSVHQVHEEMRRGGWVPPCTMSIEDRHILEDQNETPDVVVASGLIALVDDCIKQRFHTKTRRQFVIPVPRLKVDVDYVGTRGLLKEMTTRSSHRESSSRRPTPLRNMSHTI